MFHVFDSFAEKIQMKSESSVYNVFNTIHIKVSTVCVHIKMFAKGCAAIHFFQFTISLWAFSRPWCTTLNLYQNIVLPLVNRFEYNLVLANPTLNYIWLEDSFSSEFMLHSHLVLLSWSPQALTMYRGAVQSHWITEKLVRLRKMRTRHNLGLCWSNITRMNNP